MASPGKKAYPLRIDPALWAAIEKLAAQELRSANAQVEFCCAKVWRGAGAWTTRRLQIRRRRSLRRIESTQLYRAS